MAYKKKTWKDRVSEFPNRRTLTTLQGDGTTYTVARAEGNIAQQGDAFSAENMNDLEGRIDTALNDLSSNVEEQVTNALPKVYRNYSIASNQWITGSGKYPYYAQVVVGVPLEDKLVDVYFSKSAVDLGILAGYCDTTQKTLLVYASEKPKQTITIDSIKVMPIGG